MVEPVLFHYSDYTVVLKISIAVKSSQLISLNVAGLRQIVSWRRSGQREHCQECWDPTTDEQRTRAIVI
jgi:hypothetical protein